MGGNLDRLLKGLIMLDPRKVFLAILLWCNFSIAQDYNEVISFCNSVSDYYKKPREILPAIIRVESDFSQNTMSSKGAYGIMQVTEKAYQDYARLLKKPYVDSFDRVKYSYRDNIRVGAWYLFVYLMQYEKLTYKQAITSYFWGSRNPKSTDIYYNKVQGNIK